MYTFERIRHIQDRVQLIPGDMSDQTSLHYALTLAKPDEVYNLAAQSFVQTSWHQAVFTGDPAAARTAMQAVLDEVRVAFSDAVPRQRPTA